MNSRSHIIILGVFLGLVGLVMLALNCLAPMYTDDWTYVFVFGTDHERIHSLWDVVRSQYAHYFIMNGRFTPQTLTQIVDPFVGKQVFNVANALMFLVFLYAVVLNVTDSRNQYYKVFSAAFVLVFLLMPGFELGFLWMNGSFNYLWAATLLLFFNYMLEKKEYSRRVFIPLFLFGLACGMTNEAFVLGLAGAYFVYYVTHRRSLTPQRVVMLAGFFIGAAILVLSPGSINRATQHEGRSLSRLFQAVVDMNNLRLFYLMLVGVVVLVMTRNLRFRQWLRRELVLLIAVALSLVFIVLTLHSSDHSRIGIELFSLLLLLRAIPWEKVGSRWLTLANVVTLIIAAFAIQASYKCYRANQQELAQVARHEGLVQTEMPDYHPCLNRFILPYAFSGIGEKYKRFGPDECISKYFEDDSIFFVPASFVREAKEHPERFGTFQGDASWPFYAVREDDGNRWAEYALLEFKPMDYATMKWPLRWFAPYLQDYRRKDMAVNIFRCKVDSSTYILAERIPSLDFRLKTITLDRIN